MNLWEKLNAFFFDRYFNGLRISKTNRFAAVRSRAAYVSHEIWCEYGTGSETRRRGSRCAQIIERKIECTYANLSCREWSERITKSTKITAQVTEARQNDADLRKKWNKWNKICALVVTKVVVVVAALGPSQLRNCSLILDAFCVVVFFFFGMLRLGWTWRLVRPLPPPPRPTFAAALGFVCLADSSLSAPALALSASESLSFGQLLLLLSTSLLLLPLLPCCYLRCVAWRRLVSASKHTYSHTCAQSRSVCVCGTYVCVCIIIFTFFSLSFSSPMLFYLLAKVFHLRSVVFRFALRSVAHSVCSLAEIPDTRYKLQSKQAAIDTAAIRTYKRSSQEQ